MNEPVFKQILNKVDKKGKAPIFLFYYYDGNEFRYFTKEKCEPKHWDDGSRTDDKTGHRHQIHNGKFRKSMDGYQDANAYLESLADKTKATHREYMRKGIVPSPSMLKSELLPEQAEQELTGQRLLLKDVFEEFIEYSREKKKGLNTIRGYITALYRLGEFEKKAGVLYLDSYTNKVHHDFEVYQSDKLNLHPNSIATTNKNLITFFKYCNEFRGLKLHDQHAKVVKQVVQTERVHLTGAELQSIAKISLSGTLAWVRDAFLFGCYTGLRYSDLVRLRTEHIVDMGAYKVVRLIPAKTVSNPNKKVKRIEIPLIPDALDILAKYESQRDLLLPVISNQRMNDYIKHICLLVGINDEVEMVEYVRGEAVSVIKPKHECISVHIARHTYATQSLIRGVPLAVLQKAMGHSDVRITMIYAKIVEEYKNQVILDAWQKPFEVRQAPVLTAVSMN